MAQHLSIRQGMGELRGYTIYRPGRNQRVFFTAMMIICAGITVLLALTVADMIQALPQNLTPQYVLRVLILLLCTWFIAAATAMLNDMIGTFMAISHKKLIYHAFGISGEIAWRDVSGFDAYGRGMFRLWGIQASDIKQYRRGWIFYVMALLNPLVYSGQTDTFVPLNGIADRAVFGDIEQFLRTEPGEQILRYSAHLRKQFPD